MSETAAWTVGVYTIGSIWVHPGRQFGQVLTGRPMVIEYALLSERLVSILLPLLPRTAKKFGTTAAGELVEGLASDTADAVGSLWQRLMTKVQGDPNAEQAIENAADNPDDARTAAALSLAFERVLREDEQFARDIERLVNQAERSAMVQAENVTVHGDDAVVQMGKYPPAQRPGVALYAHTTPLLAGYCIITLARRAELTQETVHHASLCHGQPQSRKVHRP